MMILFALILRGVAFEFHGKVDSDKWRKVWDACIFIGRAVPAILFGVAFANIFKGILLDQNGIYQGNLFTRLNVHGLLGSVLFLLLFLGTDPSGCPLNRKGIFRPEPLRPPINCGRFRWGLRSSF